MQASELGTLLSVLARQIRNPRIDYYQVLDQVKKVAERKNDAALLRIVKNHIPDFVQILTDLERQGQVTLIREGGTVRSVEVASYFVDAVRSIYVTIGDSPSTPFPDKETLKMEVPPSNLMVADIKQDFSNLLRQQGKLDKEIIRINFPEGIEHIYVPAEVVGPRLVEMAVAKLSLYVQDQRNLGYLSSKLRSVFAGSEIALTNALNDLVSRSGKASQSLFDPGEFSLKFWTHLASLVLQDLTKKKDKSREDHGSCQSCYVIGHYVVYQKGVQAREQERSADTKRIEGLIKKPPYAFTLEEVLNLKDPKGVPFAKKHTRQFVVDFLQSRIQTTDTGRLPQVVRLRGSGDREYFVPREFVAPLTMSKVHECAEDLRKQYVAAGMEIIKTGQRTGGLADDQKFATEVRTAIQSSYPLLHVLLNGDLLFLAREEIDATSPVRGEIDGCFSAPRKLKPAHQILGLERKKILHDAGALLPAWYTTPILKQLFFLFRSLFSGKPKKKAQAEDWVDDLAEGDGEEAGRRSTANGSPGESTKELSTGEEPTSAAYKARVKLLVKEFAGSEKKIDGTLVELAEKWNPLVDDAAKRNLVADVDSFIRDFVRSLRRGFRVKPPDAARIRNLAGELAQKQQLAQIRRKDYLQRYIEISMIKLLLKR